MQDAHVHLSFPLFSCVSPLAGVLLHRPPPGFVWPSTRLQRDLMTFIIRWGNLIWAAPLSEMSSSIQSHAGENKRVSNYSLGVLAGGGVVGAVCGWREYTGSRHWEKERHWQKKETPSVVLWKESIVSCLHHVMRYELGSVSSLWPEQCSPLLSTSTLGRLANKEGKPGEHEELFVGWTAGARLVMCD